MTVNVRAATSTELTLLRSEQLSQVYLDIWSPQILWQGQLALTPTSLDQVVQLQYGSVTKGGSSIVQPGLELWVGSSASGNDLGKCRIRKAADSTYLYIGETGEILFSQGNYLTLVQQYSLWPKHWFTTDSTTYYMDWDVAYTDQYTNPAPIPVLGPTAGVLWLVSGSATLTLDARNSYYILGSTWGSVTSYSWSVSGGSGSQASISGSTSGSTTLTVTAAGQYLISCTVGTVGGKTTTGYRYLFVHDSNNLPINSLQVNSCTADHDQGGWQFSVTMYDQSAFPSVQDQALCVLHSKDWYGTSACSIGQIPGYENIIAVGWIDGQTIDFSGEIGTVKFTVKNATFWLDKIQSFPLAIYGDLDQANSWLNCSFIDVDVGNWQLLHWRTTADTIMDVILSGDTRQEALASADAGTALEQLKNMSYPIFAYPITDRFGRLFVQIDCQMIPYASRTGITTIQPILKNDWTSEDPLDIEYIAQTPYAWVNVSGYAWSSSASMILLGGQPYLSRSPGRTPGHFGQSESMDRLILNDQDDANTTCGLYAGWINNPYPTVNITITENNKMIDIAPCQYVTLSISGSDTPRGITWTNRRLIPRKIDLKHDPKIGAITGSYEFEAETFQQNSVTIIPLQPVITGVVPVSPITPTPSTPTTPGSGIWIPTVVPIIPYGPTCLLKDLADGPYGLIFDNLTINPGQTSYASCHCYLRPSTNTHKSTLRIGLSSFGSTPNLTVTAIDANKNTIVAGNVGTFNGSYIEVTFYVATNTEVQGFAIKNNVVVPQCSGSTTGGWYYTWVDRTVDTWLPFDSNLDHPWVWDALGSYNPGLPWVFGGLVVTWGGNEYDVWVRYASKNYHGMSGSDMHSYPYAKMDRNGIAYYLTHTGGLTVSGTPDQTAAFNALISSASSTGSSITLAVPTPGTNWDIGDTDNHGTYITPPFLSSGLPSWVYQDSNGNVHPSVVLGSDDSGIPIPTFKMLTARKWALWWCYGASGSPILNTTAYLNNTPQLYNVCGYV